MLKKISTIILLPSFLAILLLVSPAFAQDATTSASTSSFVAPAVLNLSLKPGEITKGSYTYSNNSGEDESIAINVVAFEPTNGDHGSSFTDKDGKAVTSPLTSWIKFEKESYVIGKKYKTEISFEINTPKDAEPGKYFAALFNKVNVNSAESDNGTSVNKQIGVRLVAEVLPLNQKPPWSSIIGIGLAVVLILLIVFLRLKKKKIYLFSWRKRKRGKHV